MSAYVDVDASVAFLSDWLPGGPWILTAVAIDKKYIRTTTFAAAGERDLRKWLADQARRKRNVYFHVNRCKRRLEKKAKKADIASMDWFHVDVDPDVGEDIDAERKRILELLQKHKGLPAPTCIVFSGGGYQAFWKLAEPIPIDGDVAKAEEAERYNLQIEVMVGGDGCHNADRIMRLPGTVNVPNEKKRKKGQVEEVANVILWEPSRVYPLSKFTKALRVQDVVQDGSIGGPSVAVSSGNVRRFLDLDTELPKGVSHSAKVAIVQGNDPDKVLSDDTRSGWLLYVCCELVRADVTDDDIYAIITDPDFRISDSVLDKGNSSSVHRYAVRQIQRAKEFCIEPWLSRLNDKYAVVESVGGKFRIARENYSHALGRPEVEFLLPDGFKMTYCNKFVTIVRTSAKGSPTEHNIPVGIWWLEHRNRRTYSEVIFYPNHDFPGTLNLWRGYACDAIPGDCGLFLDHVRKNLCRGIKSHYDYLIGWMAHCVQYPHLPGQVAVVMRGRQGTGKGMFARMFGKLFGRHYKPVTNNRHLVGNFNAQLQDAVLVFADEAFSTNNKTHESALKALITEATIMVELKGVDVTEMRNCIHLIMASNDDWVVPVRLDDRRFFIVDVTDAHRIDHPYFKAMEEQMDNGGREALLHYLLHYDLSEFDVRTPPKTDELRRQQQQSLTDVEAFWFQRLYEGRLMPAHGDWKGYVLKNELVDAFIAETGVAKKSVHGIKTHLGMFYTRLVPGFKSDRQRGQTTRWIDSRGKERREENAWLWIFADLPACRARWDAEFGRQEWPDMAEPVDVAVDVPEAF